MLCTLVSFPNPLPLEREAENLSRMCRSPPQIFHNISHKQEKDLRPWLPKHCKNLCNCSVSISTLKLYHFRACARLHSGRKWKSKKKNCSWDWVGFDSSRRGAGFNSFFTLYLIERRRGWKKFRCIVKFCRLGSRLSKVCPLFVLPPWLFKW